MLTLNFLFGHQGWAEEELTRDWLIRPFVQVPLNVFYTGTPDVANVAYLPNVSPALGTKVMYKNLGVSAAAALPLPQSEIDRRGNTRQQTFVFSSYRKGHYFDVYYQRFVGLYLAHLFDEFDLNRTDRYPQLPDARLETYGMNYHYSFNPDAINLRAAFDQTDHQKAPGGAWILSPFVNRLRISPGNSFIPSSSSNFPTQAPQFAAGTYDNAGATLGYAYCWLWGFYGLAVHGGFGPALQLAQFQKDASTSSNRLALAGKINGQFAAAYNSETFHYGFKIFADSISSDSAGVYMANTIIVATVFLGWKL